MSRWADIQDMYGGDGNDLEPAYRSYEPELDHARGADTHIDYLTVKMVRVPKCLKRRGLLRLLLFRQSLDFRQHMKTLFEQKQQQLRQDWQKINGAYSTCNLSITVCLKPPRLLQFRHREAVRQAMIAGFTRPSTQIDLHHVIKVVVKGLCDDPDPLVLVPSCISRITAAVYFAERDSVEIKLERRNQLYDIKQM